MQESVLHTRLVPAPLVLAHRSTETHGVHHSADGYTQPFQLSEMPWAGQALCMLPEWFKARPCSVCQGGCDLPRVQPQGNTTSE